MPEPCHSCERREIDWGGCRCQALAIAGDAAEADPACAKAPSRALIEEAILQSADAPLDLIPRRLAGQ